MDLVVARSTDLQDLPGHGLAIKTFPRTLAAMARTRNQVVPCQYDAATTTQLASPGFIILLLVPQLQLSGSR